MDDPKFKGVVLESYFVDGVIYGVCLLGLSVLLFSLIAVFDVVELIILFSDGLQWLVCFVMHPVVISW